MSAILALINEMSPYLLLGFFLAGLMHVFIPSGWYTKYLAAPNFRSVLLAALFGVPLPLCSCGVLPTAMSLRKEGASHGATISFLIATPQTGVDSIIATYSLMGLPFAILRPIVAFFTAVGGGWLVDKIKGTLPVPTAPSNLPLRGKATEPNGECDEACGCGHCHCGEEHSHHSLWGKIKEVMEYAFVEMMGDIGKWLVVGLVVAGLITVFVPDSFFAVFKDNSLLSMLLVLAIAIPMYICATGSIPIAVALMMKGLTPGAGLVLLMAGPACNVASILVIGRVLGRRTLLTYLASIIAGSVGFGLVIDHLLPRDWFTPTLLSADACCAESHTGWFGLVCTIVLALLLINALLRSHHHDHGTPSATSEHLPLDGEDNSASETMSLTISGMNCSHCAANAQKALLAVPGVESVEVSLADGTARVAGTVSFADLAAALADIGFKAEQQG